MKNEKFIRYLGIDWGAKRIGLALGDSEVKIASPFIVVNNINEILRVIKEEDVDKIILGKPVKMSGDKNLSDEFLSFVKLLKKRTKLPIKTIDERLTSKAADALIGTKKTKAPQDAIAAMIILQSYLDIYE